MAELIRGDIINAGGRDVKFGDNTGRACPVCSGKGSLHIRSIIDNTAQLECPNCGYNLNLPKEEVIQQVDFKGRPIK